MQSLYKITLPVKPHIRKYIHIRYGCPFTIDHRTILGTLILTIADKKTIRCNIFSNNLTKRMELLTAKVECFVLSSTANRYGFILSDDKVVIINRMLEDLFNEELCMWVTTKVKDHGRYKGYDQAIRNFIQHYQLDEEIDIKFDTLQKAVYRRRLEMEKNKEKLMAENVHSQLSGRPLALF